MSVLQEELIRSKMIKNINDEINFVMMKVMESEEIKNEEIGFLYVLDNEKNNLEV